MRLHRRLVAILILPALLLAVLAGAFLMRAQLAEMVIRGQISARGLESQLRVARVGLHEAELRGGVVEAVMIDGVTVTVDLTGKGPLLGDLQRLLESTGERTWTRLPDLTLRQARVLVLMPREQLPVDVSADIVRGAGDTAALSLNASGQSRDLRASGLARAKFEGLVPVEGVLTADVAHRREPLKLSLRANTETLRAARPETQYSLTAEGPLAALARDLGYAEAWRPQSGAFRLTAEGRISVGVTPKPFDRPEADAALRLTLSDVTLGQPADWLRSAGGTATAQVKFAGQTLEGSAAAALAGGRGKLDLKLPLLRLLLDQNYGLDRLTLADFSAVVSGFPTPYGRFGDVAIQGSLEGPAAAPQGPLRITAAAPSLRLNDVVADGVALTANVTVTAQDAGYRVTLSAPGRLRLRSLRLPALLPLRGFDAAIPSGTLDLKSVEGGWQIAQAGIVAPPPLSLQLIRKDAPPLPMTVRLRPISYRVEIPVGTPSLVDLRTRIDQLALPEARTTLKDSDVRIVGDPIGVIAGTLSGGTVAQETETPLFAPLTPQFRVTRRGAALEIVGTLRRGADVDVAANGRHDLTAGRGRMHLDLKPILFSGRGGDRERISPMLAGMDALRGRAQGQADLTWDADGFDSKGVVTIQDLSFTRQGLEIEDLDTVLTLDHLIPLASAAHQKVTIRRIGAGVDLTELDLRFALATRPDGAPRLAAETLAVNVLGGRLTAEGGTIDPVSGDAKLTLKPDGLDLGTLIQQLGFKELTGAGKIAGAIPLTLDNGTAQIADAELHAEGPGRIAFKSPDTRQALASGGDAVKLMLDALEDFRFETFRITLDKPKQGDSKVLIQLNGNNPAVLDGQVFHLNISLAGNVDPLLAALAESQRLRNELLQPLFRLQPAQ
jgi:hypothetical protein